MSNQLLPEEREKRDRMYVQGYGWCSRCQQFYPIEDFYRSGIQKDINNNYGLRRHCIKCTREHAKRRKFDNKELAKRRNAGRKAFWVKELGGRCQCCGFNDYLGSLEFHHVDPDEKEHWPAILMNNGNATDSFYNCRQEFDKCCLLCSNCHHAITSGELILTYEKIEFGYTVSTFEIAQVNYDDEYHPQLDFFNGS